MQNKFFGSVTSLRYLPIKWKSSLFCVLGLAIILSTVYFAFPQYHAVQATHGSNTGSAGDWPMYMYNVSRRSYNASETIISPSTASSLKQSVLASDSSTPLTPIFSQPIVSSGIVYWGSFDGVEHATRIDGSGELWEKNLGSTSSCDPSPLGVVSSAAVVNGVVYVGGGDHNIYALNASTGKIKWNKVLGGSPPNTFIPHNTFIWDSPLVVNGYVYIGTATTGEGIPDCNLVQGLLYQLDAATGTLVKVYKIVPDNCVGGGLWSSPVYDPSDKSIYFTAGTEQGNPVPPCAESNPIGIVKLDATSLHFLDSWQIPLQQRQTNDADFAGTPTLFTANGTKMVGAVDKNGYFYAFKRASIGKGPRWSVKIADGGACPQCGKGSISSAVWDGGNNLYVAGGNTLINGQTCPGSLQDLYPATGTDPITGKPQWQHCLPKTVLGALTLVPGVIAVVATPYLYLLNSQTGGRLFTSNNNYYGSASISNGVLYVGSKTGQLYAFSAQ